MSDPVDRARELRSTADARALYRDWAATYDRDVFDRAGITGSVRIADVFAAHEPDRDVDIVDLGCGTGAVGRHLAHLGYRSIIGLDLSPEMLTHAVPDYRALVVADLHRPPVRAGAFGASVSAGTFTSGHLGASDVLPLLALVRSGGLIAWTVAEPAWPAIRSAVLDAGARIVDESIEPIRPGTTDRAVMLVARTGKT